MPHAYHKHTHKNNTLNTPCQQELISRACILQIKIDMEKCTTLLLPPLVPILAMHDGHSKKALLVLLFFYALPPKIGFGSSSSLCLAKPGWRGEAVPLLAGLGCAAKWLSKATSTPQSLPSASDPVLITTCALILASTQSEQRSIWSTIIKLKGWGACTDLAMLKEAERNDSHYLNCKANSFYIGSLVFSILPAKGNFSRRLYLKQHWVVPEGL